MFALKTLLIIFKKLLKIVFSLFFAFNFNFKFYYLILSRFASKRITVNPDPLYS